MNSFDDIHPRDLRYCLIVMGELNMVRAAAMLGVTQTTLTYAVQRVEESLGHQLFRRLNKGLEPTPEGLRFSPQAETILREHDKLRAALRPSDSPSGVYRLGCHPVVGAFALGGVISKLMVEFPEMTFSINTHVSREVLSCLHARKLDFGIVVNPGAHKEMVMRPLADDSFTVWKSTSLGQKQREAQERILYYDRELFQSQKLVHELASKNFSFSRAVPVQGLDLAATLACHDGYALLPTRVANRYPELRVVEMAKGTPACKDKFYLVYHLEVLSSPGSKLLARRLESSLKDKLSKDDL